MSVATYRSTDIERESVVQNWHLGLTSSEAARAWMRAPDSALLSNERIQRAYADPGVDHRGHRLGEDIAQLVRFIQSAGLGHVAVRVARGADRAADPLASSDPNYIIVRDLRHPTWIALVEEWVHGISVYSRWAHVATVNVRKAASEQDFVAIIRAAQRLSARRPPAGAAGPDYVDPAHPRIEGMDDDDPPITPDIWDRIVTRIRRLI